MSDVEKNFVVVVVWGVSFEGDDHHVIERKAGLGTKNPTRKNPPEKTHLKKTSKIGLFRVFSFFYRYF